MIYQNWRNMNNLERIDKLISRVENLVEEIEKLITMQNEIDKKYLI